MKYIPTGNQMREADQFTINQIGLPSMVLMERAALKVVEAMEGKSYDLSKVLVVCGAGNNGGDGYAIARLLHLQGHPVEIYFMGKECSRSEENRKQKKIADYYQIPTVTVTDLEKKEYSIIIDALFGTGLKREITGDYYDLITLLNQKSGVKVAVDIPSGIHDTTGNVMGTAFQADLTVAIAFLKRGVVFYPGGQYAGEIYIGDIGITQDSIPKEEKLTFGYDFNDLGMRFPKRFPNSHKGTYGKALMIVGSKGMSGAAYLSAKAAYAVGVGLVQIYTAEENRVILQQLLPEAIISTYKTYDEKQLRELVKSADVIGIGSGLGKSETSVKIVEQTMKEADCPCVVDADAINILAEHMSWIKERKNETIFTPHIKEMSRMLHCSVGELLESKMEYLTKFVSEYEVTCVLKDARTLVAKYDEDIYLNLSGNEAMAKAGSGDVLTGIITGIAVQMKKAYEAACLGVYLHGLSGDCAKKKKGSYSVLASDLIDGIGEVLKEIV